MDLQFGDDGAFYLLTYGDGFFAANPDAGMYKWEYVKGARAPQAVLSASVDERARAARGRVLERRHARSGPVGLDHVRLGSRRGRPDGRLHGSQPGVDVHPERRLRRQAHGHGLVGQDGHEDDDHHGREHGPDADDHHAVDGDFFEWGDDIPFTITGSDPEDGAIDCDQVAVTMVLVHDQHGHGEDSATGCSGTLETDADDSSHGGYIAGGINVTYTDTGANGQPPLTTQVQHVIQIRRQQAEFMQDQSGTAPANLPGAEPDFGGGLARTGLDDGDWLAINNRANLTNMNKEISFRFGAAGTAGTDRARVEIHLDSPTGPIATTATLKSTGNNNTYTTQTFPLDFTGSRRVYLVFKPVAGGVTTAFGNLNWVEFSGPGAGV